GLLGGPVGGGLIRKFGLKTSAPASVHLESGAVAATGILTDLKTLALQGKIFGIHLLVLLACVKLGTWVSFFIQKTGITFPVYIGAMLLGVGLRNAIEFSGGR